MKPSKSIFSKNELTNLFDSLSKLKYHQAAAPGKKQKRLIEHLKTRFYNADLTSPLPDGKQGALGIKYENYQLAYTPALLQDIFTPSQFSASFEVTAADLQEGRFLLDDSNWWIRSGTAEYARAGETFEDIKNRFFAPTAFIDPFETRTEVFYDAHNLFITRSVDALGNESKVLSFDFRTLAPLRMQDINDNISSIMTDELGLVKASAVEGKDADHDQIGEEADNLSGLREPTEGAEADKIRSFFQTARVNEICNYSQLQSIARDLLSNATARFVYDFSQQPAVVAAIVREQHAAQNAGSSPLQISFEYSDGFGKVAMKKVQAEPGMAKMATRQIDGTWKIEDADTGNQLRWVGSGRTVLNNKGNPIKQYEPYFSVTPAYEEAAELVASGVSLVMFYDAASRLIKTEFPNGTFSKVIFDSWKEFHFDVNDTVKDSRWYTERIALAASNPEKEAALKTELHYNTPACVILDTLGRPALGIDHNRFEDADGNLREEFYYTHTKLDIEGNALSVTDARGNVVMQYRYDLLGHRVAQTSMDAGKRWMLNNALGNPVKTWDERRHEFSFEYDALHRPAAKRVKGGDGLIPLNLLFERIIYGENQPNAKQNNLRGKAFILYDTAGKIISDHYDFKGNLTRGTRIFAKDYKKTPDWNTSDPDALLETSDYIFATISEYDALNRPVRQTTPDGTVTIPAFNPAGLLEKVDVKQGTQTKPFVKNIDYDAKGQRTRIVYGNDVTTSYDYDPETFRLTGLKTAKIGGDVLQDLRYTYDPTGNIIQIEDKAIPVVFFNNQKIVGKNEYVYDALYRLISATGREQNTNPPSFGKQDNWNDAAYMFAPHSSDPMAMRNYAQRYQYDPVGNIEQMRHQAGTKGSWKRDYVYESQNNRLKNTTVDGHTYRYPHHAHHGFMVEMPHLQMMAWTFKEELQATSKQRRTDGGIRETTYYVYDGSGQRVRKITENQADAGFIPAKKDERLYLGGFEVYRNQNGLERETLHVMDDRQRIAMIDTETAPGTSAGRTSPIQTIRYQMGNHLGSVSLELDENAAVISFEEYHPYGTTAYQAKNSTTKATAKRYRYTGMERDEETGLAYHGARYYVIWLGRWTSADPTGLAGGTNGFAYGRGAPTRYVDPTGTIDREAQLWLSHQLTQIVRATRSTRGFDKMLSRDMTKASDAFGPGGATHAGHDKAFGITKSQELGTVRPQNGPENSSLGATVDKQLKDRARAAGEFARDGDVHTAAPKGVRMPRPPQAAWRASFRQWPGSVPVANPTKPTQTTPTAPVVPSAQMEFDFNKPAATVAANPPVTASKPLVQVAAAGQLATSRGVETIRNNSRAAAVGATGGALARYLIPGADVVLDTVAAVGVRGAVTLGARAGAPALAFAAGAMAGIGIQEGSAYLSKKYLGSEVSPGQMIGDTLTNSDHLLSKVWSDPNKPEHTQTLGWKIAGWLTPISN